MPTTLEIDVHGRRAAVELLGRLACCHSHLVQLDLAGERWLVRVRTPGEHGEDMFAVLAVLEEWQREREIDSVGVCIVGMPPVEDDLRPRVAVQTGTSL